MNNQTTLNKYFKIKVQSFKRMEGDHKKKYNLSLKKTPTKSPKLSLEDKNVQSVIDLVSDNEELMSPKTCEFNHSKASSSESTVLYTPETPRKSTLTSSSSVEILNKVPLTPTSDRRTLNKSSPNSHSPSTRHKYFSPTKKRKITVKSPTKVRRNLCHTLSQGNQNIFNNQDFIQASQGVDDMTIFLLKIIYQFLCDDNLKPLLSESSCDLLSKAMEVKKPGMRLVCRLYWQQDGWRRWEQVKKIMSGKGHFNDPILQEAIYSLVESRFIDVGNSCNGINIDFDGLVKLLKLEELKLVCKDLKIKATRKEDAVQSLRNYCFKKTNITNYFVGSKITNESRVLNILRSKVGPCYKLSDDAYSTLKELYILMYLGMDYSIIKENRLELVLLNEKLYRETYPIDKDMEIDNASVVFKNREEFVRYMNAGSIYDDLEATTQLTKRCEIIESVYNLYKGISKDEMMRYTAIPIWLRRFTPAYIYVKILEAGIQDLKKEKIEKNLSLAIDILSTLIKQNIFRQHKKAEWYAEKALILDKLLFRANEAAEALLEGFNANLPELTLDFMRPRAKLIAKRQTNAISTPLKAQLLERAEKNYILEKNIKAVHIYKQPMYDGGRGKIKFETRTADGRLVHEAEEYCIYHYINEGKYTHGGHWEGRIVTTIFFLLFWDIIYTQPPGVRGIFLSHYQVYPLDMFNEGFYNNRKLLIQERLKEIEESSIEDILLKMQTVWDSRPESELSGVQRSIGWEAVCGAAARLAPRRVAALARRLAAHYPHAHSGFPDLTLWNEHTGEITFVEVKTDSDKPSMKQIQWMHYMKKNDINTEFCYVGVNTTRAKSRNTQHVDD